MTRATAFMTRAAKRPHPGLPERSLFVAEGPLIGLGAVSHRPRRLEADATFMMQRAPMLRANAMLMLWLLGCAPPEPTQRDLTLLGLRGTEVLTARVQPSGEFVDQRSVSDFYDPQSFVVSGMTPGGPSPAILLDPRPHVPEHPTVRALDGTDVTRPGEANWSLSAFPDAWVVSSTVYGVYRREGSAWRSFAEPSEASDSLGPWRDGLVGVRFGSAGTPALWWDYSSGAAELVQRLPDFDSVLAGSREALLVTRGPSVELHRRDGTTAQWEGTQGCLRRGRVIVLGSDKRTLSVFDAAEPGSAERSVRLGFSVDWM